MQHSQPQARIPRAVEDGGREETRDAFRKEQLNWSQAAFDITKSVTGPSLNVTHPQEPFPKERKFLPHNLSWK